MRGLVVVLVLGLTTTAHADDGIRTTEEPPAADAPSKHLVYLELLGKGGAYGLGYEYAITSWLGFGGVVSYSNLRDQQVFTASPYLHVTALGGTRHFMFCELGAIIAHARVPSPVMNWDGMADTGGGGFASLGWEYRRRHLVLRTSGGVSAGEGGVLPMLGFSIGARP